MFLAKGRLAFFGEPEKSIDFMRSLGFPCPLNYNPADSIIDVAFILVPT
jgi:hypothetical protein